MRSHIRFIEKSRKTRKQKNELFFLCSRVFFRVVWGRPGLVPGQNYEKAHEKKNEKVFFSTGGTSRTGPGRGKKIEKNIEKNSPELLARHPAPGPAAGLVV